MRKTRRCFSAVVCHRNRPEVLRDSLARLESQWGEWLSEILVVDDGSSDDRIPPDKALPSTARLIRFEDSRGPALRRNQAVAETVSPFVLFLDDDSFPWSGGLEETADAFADESLGAVGFRVLLADQCESGGAFNAFIACGACVRRSAFLDAGGFPADFGFYVEEYALCYRMIERGWRVRMDAEPVVRHLKTGGQRSQSTILTQLVLNNRRIFEPHALLSPAVARRLEEILQWYELLGRRMGAADEVRAARTLALPSQEFRKDCWSESLWRKLSGLDRLAEFADALHRVGVRRASLWPIGKDCRTFCETLTQFGVEVLAILDPENRYGQSTCADRPVLSAAAPGSQGIVVASFSPGQCYNGVFGSALQGCSPVYAGFPFEGPLRPEPGRLFQRRVGAAMEWF